MQASSFSSIITPSLWLIIASRFWRSQCNVLHSSVKRFTELSASEASQWARSNTAALVHNSSLVAWNSSLTNHSSSSIDLRPSTTFFSLSSVLAFTVEVCFRSNLYPQHIISQTLYPSLQLGPLRSQGGDLILVCSRRPSRALDQTSPPRQVLYISSRLPKNKMELADNINTTVIRIKEGTHTYRDDPLERKGQSLLNAQGCHFLEIRVSENRRNNPGSDLRISE